jgi:ATP-dependent RNA helicase DDX10/DBP4
LRTHPHSIATKSRQEAESAEIDRLDAVLTASDGVDDDAGGAAAAPVASTAHRFADFPISRRTLDGLEAGGFTTPTPIQRQTLLRALRGEDILGAAKTGSGKTLAFLIPVIEKLWRMRWSKMDGVGAVVISPTRELALQTFQALAAVGGKHDMSAGLIIGGTTFEREQANIPFTNILICTPGRLLQHLDETPNFDCMQVQVLVLDEADRILDLGFAKAMDAIVRAMPKSRQTLLFSATQTSDISELARLSLNSPTRVDTNPASESATPDSLVQA